MGTTIENVIEKITAALKEVRYFNECGASRENSILTTDLEKCLAFAKYLELKLKGLL